MARLPVLLQLLAPLLAASWDARHPGEVRCFCNLPACVSSSYMCKSPRGACFSDLRDSTAVDTGRHGCVELLHSSQHELCQNRPSHKQGYNKMLLLCCHKDMCNHVDGPDIHLRFNGTFSGSTINSSEGTRLFFSETGRNQNYNNNEVWFKAATIAVPICGSVILLVLIALAVKMLRKDGVEQSLMSSGKHKDKHPHRSHFVGLTGHRKSSPNHLNFHRNTELSSKNVPLLLQHHNQSTPITLVHQNVPHATSKNEANAKLNCNALAGTRRSVSNDYSLLVHPSHTIRKLNNVSNNNLYPNMNIDGTAQMLSSKTDEKLYNKQQLASLVAWKDVTSGCPV